MTRNFKKGWIRDNPDHRDCRIEYERIGDLPAQVDLRPTMPKVYDQGELGSCVSNAVAAAIEHQLITQKLQEFTPSRLFIYFNGRIIENCVQSDSGLQVRDAIKTVVAQGVCEETMWPYTENQFAVKPPDACYADAKKNIVESYTKLGQNLPTLKSALAKGYPIVFGATIYESFESDKVADTGIVPMPTTKEECLGGHSQLIAGYDDAQHAFLVRNSWGVDFGIGGYEYIPYNYITDPNLASDFWVIKLVL